MQSWGKAPAPSVIIDLSPIVLLRGNPNWGWVEAAVEVWRKQHDPQARFYGVADNSLYYKLDEAGKRGLSQWKRKRMARSVSWADPEVLELATQFDTASVLTTDLFRDHRRDFPWLQGTDRIWKPVVGDGTLGFERLDYAPIPAMEVSWRIEEADLTPKGFKTREARDALKYEWRCTTSSCHWASEAVIEEDPAIRDGRVVCPACSAPASRLGFRESTKEIVLLLGDDEVDRLPVPERSELTVGRGRDIGRYDVREVLEDAAANKVSRDHLKLINNGGRIFVEELGSKNGTNIVRDDGVAAQLQECVQQALAPNEHLTLAGGALTIRLSGKKRPRGTYEPDLTTPPFLRVEGN
ncbi:FHA domain-containing protein [Rhodococcus sp. IEGM 1351]|uniref:FHA domain-containing protein n=1 Tax=Rhodococcus sp. IEGM 1351 TaxID=3047089 RepID=UPI0024B69EC1|nr:FHA domain-containing protein [Rhodococcus sp. IEGM 1351]MDI9941518.1 FHA domain-containing protein [Rhodococcus sp. IEGM 1351]